MVSSQAAGWWYCNERETWQGAGRAKKTNPVYTRGTMKSCVVLEGRYGFILNIVYTGAGPTAAEAQFQLSRTLQEFFDPPNSRIGIIQSE